MAKKVEIELDVKSNVGNSIADLKELKKQLKQTAAGSEDFKKLYNQIDDLEDKIKSSKNTSKDFLDITKSVSNKRYWEVIFEKVYRGKIDTWDYQWLFANWLHKRRSIIPNSNLISNIGFGQGATHTKTESEISNLPSQDLVFPLTHPDLLKVDLSADLYTEKNYFSMKALDLLKKVANKLLGGSK
jgi:hypothetical protein